jgi:anti-sigma-K factor RskA
MPKGAAITLSATVDLQQSNPMHYKSTDETAKFEQVRRADWRFQLVTSHSMWRVSICISSTTCAIIGSSLLRQ